MPVACLSHPSVVLVLSLLLAAIWLSSLSDLSLQCLLHLKFHTEPHYPLGGSELSGRFHTLGWILHFGLTPSIGTKA